MENVFDSSKVVVEFPKRKYVSSLNFYTFQGGKIKTLQSSDEQYEYFANRYGSRSLLAFFTMILLCILDGQFTLKLIEKGVTELNPFMDVLIQTNIPMFWFCKIYLTVLGLYLLLLYKDFNLPIFKLKIKHVVVTIIAIYGVIVSGEIFLLSRLC